MSKPKRVKCVRCGRMYDEGMPHEMFCQGRVPKGSVCIECGEDDHGLLSECKDCGEIVCDCCIDNNEHVC